MNPAIALVHRLSWLHLPGAILIALLQRTPVLRLMGGASESALRSSGAAVLKSAAALMGGLGSMHTLAGATTLSATSPSPLNASVGVSTTVVFSAVGAQSPAQSWTVGGSVPPGLSFNGGKTSGIINTASPTMLMLSGTPTAAGTYQITLRAWEKINGGGSGSPTFTYTVNVTGGAMATAPTFTTQPASQTVTTGANVTFTVAASGSPAPTYAWFKDGVALSAQTGPSLILASVQTSAAGSYTCRATNSAGTVTSASAQLTVNPPASAVASVLTNVSVRTTLAQAQILIVGFTMQGGAKPVLVRAVGPGLGEFGVPGFMPDPKLALYQGTTELVANDNWGGGSALSTAFASVGAFPLRPTSADAALLRAIEGGHTAQITGTAAGNVLVEAYDAGSGAAHLTNVSARNWVGTGSDILIAGFTVAGTAPKNLLVRAVGPTLGVFGVPGTLALPKLAIYSAASGAKVAETAAWDPSLASVFVSVGAFALSPGSKDAALTISLPPGGYTVQVSGADGGTGEALIELYELP